EPRRLVAGEFVVFVRGFLDWCCGRLRRRLLIGLRAGVARQVARPDSVFDLEPDAATVAGELNGVERQLVGLELFAGACREPRRELRMVERRAALALLYIDDHEFARPALEVVAVPEAGVVREPVRRNLGLVDACDLPPAAAAELAFVRLLEVVP